MLDSWQTEKMGSVACHLSSPITLIFPGRGGEMMPIALNIYAGVLTVAAMFLAFIISGRAASGDIEIAKESLPFVFASCLIGLDLIVRTVSGFRSSRRSDDDVLVIHRGPALRPPRLWHKAVLEALFSPEMGGQYFQILPVWLIGILIIAAVMIWGNPLVSG